MPIFFALVPPVEANASIIEKDKKQNAGVSDVSTPLNAESAASGISNMPAAGGITVSV